MFTNRHLFHGFGSTITTLCLASVVALTALSGCGNRQRYSVTRVSGKITYEDGTLIPAPRIRLVFHSLAPVVDTRNPPRDGGTAVDVKTGEFKAVTTFENGDGIIVGDHKVQVQCVNSGGEIHNLIPAEYSDPEKTPLKVKSSDSPFVFKIPKPHK